MSAQRPWLVVPAKSFARGKSRLAAALPPGRRAELARRLLEHVLDVALELGWGGCLVLTDGADTRELAVRRGLPVVLDPPASPRALAAVVDVGLAEATRRGATHALVVMADLPHVTAAELREVRRAAGAGVAVAVDEQGRYTSALWLPLPAASPTRFGEPDSAARHLEDARAAGLGAVRLELPGVAFDVDGPEDYARWRGAER